MFGNTVTISNIKGHPQYDPDTLRIKLPLSQMQDMPVKYVNSEEMYEIMHNADYNPARYYSHYVPLHVGEVGHDLVNRYVLQHRND